MCVIRLATNEQKGKDKNVHENGDIVSAAANTTPWRKPRNCG
jgi:hypothetical protein